MERELVELEVLGYCHYSMTIGELRTYVFKSEIEVLRKRGTESIPNEIIASGSGARENRSGDVVMSDKTSPLSRI